MIHAILFSVLGIGLAAIAWGNGGAWYLLLWVSVDFLVIAIGYAGAGPKVFGKGPSGAIPYWAKLLFLPYFLFSGSVWHIARLLIREPAYNEVVPGVIIGRRLLAREVPSGIAHYVDLTSEFEDPPAIRNSSDYICLPTLDASVPMKDALKTTLSQAREGLTYVHCAQGHGRSALFTILLLAERGVVSNCAEGLALLRKARPAVRLNKKQLAFVEQYMARER